jgi:DNA-binding CsgD family transcriptional regulator
MQLSSEGSTGTGKATDPKREGAVSSEHMGGDDGSPATASEAPLFPTSEDDEEVGSENGDDGHQLEAKDLTPRQREILDLYRREKSAPKVGRLLEIRSETVSKHLASIRDKRGMGDIRELLGDYVAPNQNAVTAAKLMKLLIEQEYRCALSGRQLEPATATLDHKLPRSAGGDHSIGNVWFLHRDVNRAKGTQTVEEFHHMCRQVCQYSEGGAVS